MIAPVLMLSSHLGLCPAPDTMTSAYQYLGHFEYTNGRLVGAMWCPPDRMTCMPDEGQTSCPMDECSHFWAVYSPPQQLEAPTFITATPGLPVEYWVIDPWGHSEQGRWAGPADYDLSGQVNSADFFAFLAAFFDGTADFDLSGAVDSTDFFVFLDDFFGA